MHQRTRFAGVRRFLVAALVAAGCSDLVSPERDAPGVPVSLQTGGDIPGLVAHWKLDEAADDTLFTDYSGSGITGSCTGSACPALGVNGQVGTAAQFTSANANTIRFGTPSILDFGTSSFSYGFWAQVTGGPASSQTAWYKGGANEGDAGFAMGIPAAGAGWSASISDGFTVRTVAGGVVYANQWTHLMAVVDRDAGTFALYEDGSLLGSTSLALLGSVTSPQTAALSCIGPSYCFDGILDDVRIYNRALSARDVQSLYAQFVGPHFYVSPSGNDSYPCTSAYPCFTMQRVSELLEPGDTAHFAAGNYAWSPQTLFGSGTVSARLTYISDVPWGARISGSCGTEGYIVGNGGDYVDIVGFDMTGPCDNGLIQEGDYGRIMGNRVHDLPATNGFAGILVNCCPPYNLTGNQVIGNVVDHIGPYDSTNFTHGIYMAGPNGVIENNIVIGAAAACITSWHGATHLIISNNTVANCGRYGIQVGADSAITTNDSTTVDNNIAVNNGRFGIRQDGSAGCNNVYYRNIVYNNLERDVSLSPCAIEVGTITLTSSQFDSLFVDYIGGDYHLRREAVAVDAGTIQCAGGVSDCVPATDLDGVPRPQGAAWDIGAYEFTNAAPTFILAPGRWTPGSGGTARVGRSGERTRGQRIRARGR
jgi:hypothetical protein